MAEVIPDSSQIFTKRYSRGHAGIVVIHLRGTTAEGSEYDWHYVSVVLVDERDLISRMEYFPDDQWAEALARFDELATEANHPMLENRATTAGQRARDAALRGDRDATLDAFAPDFTRAEYRTAAMSLDATAGREIYVDGMLAGPDAGLTRFDATALEVVGDDHALTHIAWHNDDGFGQEWLLVGEVDDGGRLRRVANFDPDDRAAASALLHLWAAEHGVVEDAPTNALTRTIATFPAFFAAGDFDGMAEVYGDPGMIVDDRRAGVSAGVVTGRDEVMGRLVQGLSDVGFRTVTSVPIAVRGDGLALFHRVWSDADGLDLPMLVLLEAAPSGRVGYQIMWSVEDFATAIAELDRRAAEPVPGNGLMERSTIRFDALDRGDRDAALATYAPDFVREDRRRGVSFGTSNREESVDALLAGNEVGLGNRSFTTVETIGDHLALAHVRMSHDDGFEVVYLLVAEDDDDGLLRRATNFDLEDRAAASALLHEWAAERGDSP